MQFIEYLFFKYYNWAVKVGDGDVPATTSVICISFCVLLYFMDIVMTYFFFISPKSSFGNIYKIVFPLVFLISFIVLYIALVSNRKSEHIMEKHKQEWTGKKHLVAILFPAIAFVWFAVALLIKASINSRI